MKFEEIGSGWLKDAAYKNSKLTKSEMRKAELILFAYPGRPDTNYVEFDIMEQHEDEITSTKKVQAVFVDNVFYIPTINYNKC